MSFNSDPRRRKSHGLRIRGYRNGRECLRAFDCSSKPKHRLRIEQRKLRPLISLFLFQTEALLPFGEEAQANIGALPLWGEAEQ